MIFRAFEYEYSTTDPLLVTLFIIIAVLVLIIFILIAAYIYKDAMRRGLNAELWLLIVLLTGPIGIIIYFIVRNEPISESQNEIKRKE